MRELPALCECFPSSEFSVYLRSGQPGRAGNGKHVSFGVLCEHLRAFARVSQKPVRGRNGAGDRTNSPSREPDEVQKALEAQRREGKTLKIHHLFVMVMGNRKPLNIHKSLAMGERKPSNIHYFFKWQSENLRIFTTFLQWESENLRIFITVLQWESENLRIFITFL